MAAVQIRPAEPQDARAIDAIARQPGVLDFILALPSDRWTDREARMRQYTYRNYSFVAEVEGEVAGYGGLLPRDHPRLAHSAELFLFVSNQYQGRGVGTALIRHMIDFGERWLRLRRLELTVMATNPRAQALYERLGFVVEGRRKGAIISRGEYVDLIEMVRFRSDLQEG